MISSWSWHNKSSPYNSSNRYDRIVNRLTDFYVNYLSAIKEHIRNAQGPIGLNINWTVCWGSSRHLISKIFDVSESLLIFFFSPSDESDLITESFLSCEVWTLTLASDRDTLRLYKHFFLGLLNLLDCPQAGSF